MSLEVYCKRYGDILCVGFIEIHNCLKDERKEMRYLIAELESSDLDHLPVYQQHRVEEQQLK
jgi:hypothetical protein